MVQREKEREKKKKKVSLTRLLGLYMVLAGNSNYV